MDKKQILEVLQSCLLITCGATKEFAIKQGLKPQLVEIGFKLHSYLKTKELTQK